MNDVNGGEHRKAVITLAIVVVLAVVVGAIYYFSDGLGLKPPPQEVDQKPLTQAEIQEIIKQNEEVNSGGTPLTPAQQQKIVNDSNKTDKDAKPLSDAEIQAIINNNK